MNNDQPSLELKPVPYAAPGHIQAAAYLYGIDTAALESARVLELGCGSGDNLLAFAFSYPNAHAVGINLWADEIEQGKKIIQDLGIQNLELHAKDFSEIDSSYGLFDYIIVHDEFTWAPPHIREAILRVCSKNLAPSGVAYISYNTYPGWKAGDTLRDAIQLHSHAASNITQAQQSAMAMLVLMSEGLAENSEQTEELKKAVKQIQKRPDYYLNSDYLQSNNSSFYFLDLVGIANEVKLAYLGDARPQEELSATYGLNVQLQHSLLALGQNKVMRQQYLDFAVSRSLRHSLFVQEENSNKVLSGPDLSRLKDLRLACSLRAVGLITEQSNDARIYVDYFGNNIKITGENPIAVCDLLIGAWPATLDFSTLLEYTCNISPEITDKPKQQEELQKSLEALFKLGVLNYSTQAAPYDTINIVSKYIEPLKFYDIKTNRAAGFNLWNFPTTPALTTETEFTLNQPNNLQNKDSKYFFEVDKLKHLGLLAGTKASWSLHYKSAIESNLDNQNYCLSKLINLILSNTDQDKQNKISNDSNQKSHIKIQELIRKKNLKDAEQLTIKIIKNTPKDVISLELLARIQSELGKTEESTISTLKALSIAPNNSNLYNTLATLNNHHKYSDWPSRLFKLGLFINKNNYLIWNNYGIWLMHANKENKAEFCFEKALSINSEFNVAYNNLATVLSTQGKVHDAIKKYQTAVKKQPENHQLYSNMLFSMAQDERISPEDLFKAHREFGKNIEKSVGQEHSNKTHKNTKTSDRTLRLGFVSADLYDHAVATFIEPIWQAFDKDKFEIYAYSNNQREDNVTKLLKSHAKQWIQVSSMTDLELNAIIEKDGIDILFDLSGHTGNNRLSMFALKPAPIQISWIGYPGTTGLLAMDYYLANKHQAPKGLLDNQFTEKIISLPVAATFKPISNSPDIGPLPALSNKHFTFGSFNRLSKINSETLTLWAKLLNEVPNSRLLLGHIPKKSSLHIKEEFEKHGVSSDRLTFHPRTEMYQYLCLHNQVDLLLDTFPYNGGTTTVHGLWMGVPTLTLSGKTMPARTGIAAMGTIGLKQFAVESESDYIKSAIEWNNNTVELADLRSNMRKHLLGTPLLSEKVMMQGLEQALKKAWQMWCAGKAAESFEVDL